MSGRASQLLRRFQLPPTATRAELRAAYFKKAKETHPDVAGKSGEEQFRRLKEEYEEAMKLMREAERYPGRRLDAQAPRHPGAAHPGRHGWQAHGGYDWGPFHQHQAGAWSAGYRKPPEAAPVEPQTPAQRIRNVVLVAGGIVVTTLILTARSGGGKRGEHSRVGAGVQVEPGSVAAAAVGSAGLAAVGAAASGGGASSPRLAPPREVSNYYKSRNTKGTVRVRGSDAYINPAAAPKSHTAEEGLGSSVKKLANVARGFSPSEAVKEDATSRASQPADSSTVASAQKRDSESGGGV
mmetsp:Transcript_50001/g.140153  ORF Transcript_50001/g.140153 Transcript_50001/m.140153 type:complete len:296 (-) Transcript_50001:60-947(-)|eukprot:CAMPEP_0117477732 /NCGR_PEP_ID=MMETSP0784-20121206/10977_1 /TAXON_ID=39447 /ORGANISM="" /LENGTH=295 /DNA_ID=CAMNT_0005272049 /DNA_START=109 /DNA_END=996 /DNA_ORIENTATION=+